ncbi:LAFE_0C08548g1_1 [Lachancea fermentati]|uniref:LAFE_0C08548g1_1 n=1 Tax=Lachancea fermentati TaxID=4955 RepID=A0A1G4MA49_LACFM|nr:LAFE_0C08548g1_1 [Lachancea fermentati]
MSEINEEQKRRLLPQLKAKLWYCVEQQLKEEIPPSVNYSPKFTNALVELCFTQLVEMGNDLEAFARHGGRETITIDDLMLLLRKSPDLQNLLQKELLHESTEMPARSTKR